MLVDLDFTAPVLYTLSDRETATTDQVVWYAIR